MMVFSMTTKSAAVVDDAVAEGEANVIHAADGTDDDVCEASSSSAVALDDDARSDSARECSSVSASASGTEAERLRFGTSLSQVYRFKDGEYVAVGAAGLAILDCASASKRSLLVYDVEKRPLVRRVIDARLTCELQRDNYVTIHHDGAILFSALTRDESDWLAVAAQITIAQFVARRESLEAIVLDISTEQSSSGGATLEKGDSVQLNYEAVRGGLPPASEPSDFLALQLFDETSKRVAGLKVKRVGDDDSVLPKALARGIIGCRKDCRRLILAPETETNFVLYDVTVLRMKKPSAKDGKGEAAVSGEKSVDEHLADATALSERMARVAHSSAEPLAQQATQPGTTGDTERRAARRNAATAAMVDVQPARGDAVRDAARACGVEHTRPDAGIRRPARRRVARRGCRVARRANSYRGRLDSSRARRRVQTRHREASQGATSGDAS